MRKIKIAQIGINKNSHGTQIFQTLCEHPEVFEIAGYALVEDERENCADRLYVFEGYKELTLDEILNDPDIEAVTVETDEIHLTKYATLAIEHGKHVHMEKPGSQSIADFEKLIEAVKASGKVFHTGYMYRYNPYVKEIIEKVRTGELEAPPIEFDEKLWHAVVDRVTVYNDDRLVYSLKDGSEITVRL